MCFGVLWPQTRAARAAKSEFIAEHPRGDDPSAPLFPNVGLSAVAPPSPESSPIKPNSRRDPQHWRIVAQRQAETLAGLSVAEAAERLALDWSQPIRHMTFYKSVFRPSVLRANRLGGDDPTGSTDPLLPPGFKFHGLRHTYASLCVAAGIAPLDISRFMGHSRVTTTLTVYAHLFDSDHADSMAAFEAMGTPADTTNVVRLRRRG